MSDGQQAAQSEAARRLRRALVELALATVAIAALAVVVEQRLGSPEPINTPLLALIALLGCWLIETITKVPVGVDRAGRVQFLSGVNALLFPSALLLPPVAYIPVAVLSLVPQVSRLGAVKAAGNAAIRILALSASAATFTLVNQGPAQASAESWLDWRTVASLLCAATVMLLAESVAVVRTVHTAEAMTSDDVPLINPTDLMSDSLDVATGALICVLHGTPVALVLLAPLFVGQYYALQAHAATLGGFRDPKTGLLTLTAFHDMAGTEIARIRRTGEPATLMMMDLDGLKQVNTTHGHLAGDRFIQAMAQVLESAVRQEDLVARFGGDEYCVLLLGLDEDDVEVMAERVRLATHNTVIPGIGVPLSVSIGVTPVTADDDIDAAIDRADQGLRTAKREGKDRIRVVHPQY